MYGCLSSLYTIYFFCLQPVITVDAQAVMLQEIQLKVSVSEMHEFVLDSVLAEDIHAIAKVCMITINLFVTCYKTFPFTLFI